ncbi:MAG: hypothetical protein OES57_13375 [Acidimicrobiia bacterium]|nr:hypothetical protein [Acidimicrobiia bacterium]
MADWSMRMWARWAFVIGACLVAFAVWLSVASSPWIGVALVPVIAAVGLFAVVDVVVDERGLVVTYGPFGWPRTELGFDQIASVELTDIKPMRWGGWGYRGAMWIGDAAVVLRGGEALRVTRPDERTFSVTVDDAAGAVMAIERRLATR